MTDRLPGDISEPLIDLACGLTGIDPAEVKEAASWTGPAIREMMAMGELTEGEAVKLLVGWIDDQVARGNRPRKMTGAEVMAWHLAR